MTEETLFADGFDARHDSNEEPTYTPTAGCERRVSREVFAGLGLDWDLPCAHAAPCTVTV